MIGFLATRGLRLFAVLVVVSFLAQLLIELLPGDPTTAILGLQASPEARAQLHSDLGLDQDPVSRYFSWVAAAAQGDLGTSISWGTPVTDTILERLPITLELLGWSILLALLIAVPLAVLTADRPNAWTNRIAAVSSLTLISTPVFILGVLLAGVVGLKLGWVDVSGYVGWDGGPGPHLQSLALPAVTLALGQVAMYYRMLQSDLLRTLREDYLLLARTRGFGRQRILWVHALRPSLTSLLTVLGLTIGSLIGGAVIIESIFGIPGLGRLLINASLARDFVMVQGVVLVIGLTYVVVNLTVDFLYAAFDPRIRL
ncbi:ABC transporter permease [Nocardioides sp. AE5]|uniref:ABC transporter permease n=1 Tax=Nocardioides sp. AE5 TaxID=2962573 RepID=UPI002881030D|nr:ABC transporter permease [Nocardioides sp. AE5]MDT0203185.1 ABC transporter permease [Nocardioides sp. AE5]